MTTAATGLAFDRTSEEHNAMAAGVEPDDTEYIDFFGFVETHKWYLPDNKQWFSFKTLTEGEVAELQSASSSEVVVQRVSGDAKMKVDQAADRHRLISKSLTGWELRRFGQIVPFPTGHSAANQIMNLIKELPPKIVADLEAEIRSKNPSLSGDRTVEDIEAQIAQLNEELEAAKKREAGK